MRLLHSRCVIHQRLSGNNRTRYVYELYPVLLRQLPDQHLQCDQRCQLLTMSRLQCQWDVQHRLHLQHHAWSSRSLPNILPCWAVRQRELRGRQLFKLHTMRYLPRRVLQFELSGHWHFFWNLRILPNLPRRAVPCELLWHKPWNLHSLRIVPNKPVHVQLRHWDTNTNVHKLLRLLVWDVPEQRLQRDD